MANFSHKALRRESAPQFVEQKSLPSKDDWDSSNTALWAGSGPGRRDDRTQRSAESAQIPMEFWGVLEVCLNILWIEKDTIAPLHHCTSYPWFIVGKNPFMKEHPILVEHHWPRASLKSLRRVFLSPSWKTYPLRSWQIWLPSVTSLGVESLPYTNCTDDRWIGIDRIYTPHENEWLAVGSAKIDRSLKEGRLLLKSHHFQGPCNCFGYINDLLGAVCEKPLQQVVRTLLS